MSARDDILARRQLVKDAFPGLFAEVTALLFGHDPIGISYLPDEYEPEVATILPRLAEARGADDVRRIMFEEFVRWFTADDAGPESRYAAPAAEVWAAYQRFKSR